MEPNFNHYFVIFDFALVFLFDDGKLDFLIFVVPLTCLDFSNYVVVIKVIEGVMVYYFYFQHAVFDDHAVCEIDRVHYSCIFVVIMHYLDYEHLL